MTVLILGGTAEARALAAELDRRGVTFLSSLAGRVSRPRLPVGAVRIGGFGGADGLAAFLTAHPIGAVVDATHPFAVGMRGNAVAACAQTSVPLLRLARPGWAQNPGADDWLWVDDMAAAARAAAGADETIFLSTGRQTLGAFTGLLADKTVLVRVVEPLDHPVPGRWTVIHTRGPFTAETERELMAAHDVRTLVTKDSGGDYTRAKLDVATARGAQVIVVRRPAPPAGMREVDTVAAAADWAGAPH